MLWLGDCRGTMRTPKGFKYMDTIEEIELKFDLRSALADAPSWKDEEDDTDAGEEHDDTEDTSDADDNGEGDDANNEDEDDQDDDVESLKGKLDKATKDLASKDAHIEKLKKENGKWRTRYRQAQKGQSSSGESGDSEEDKATAEADKLKKENRDLKLTTAMADAMADHKFHDRELVRGLVLKELEDVDDISEATEDIPGVVEALVKERPYLVKAEDKKGDDEDEDDKDDDAPASGRSSRRKKKGEGSTSETDLIKRFPALTRR